MRGFLYVLSNNFERQETDPLDCCPKSGTISRNSEQSSQFIPISSSHRIVVVIAVIIRDLPLS